MLQATYCKRHAEVETSVSCGRCGDPICPRCMVHAPVGVRCPDCGKSRPAPTFDVSTPFLLRGTGAGLAVALGGGLLVSFISVIFGTPFLAALLIAALGYIVGEAISVATNRKRGVRLRVVAVVSVLLGFMLITAVTQGLTLNVFALLGAGAACYIAVSRV